MSKILDATCLAGVVKIQALPVAGASVLSEGVKASTGILIIEEDKATYVTSSAEDVKDLITNIGTVIDQIVLALTALDAVTTSPGSAATAIALVTTLKATLTAQGSLLK